VADALLLRFSEELIDGMLERRSDYNIRWVSPMVLLANGRFMLADARSSRGNPSHEFAISAIEVIQNVRQRAANNAAGSRDRQLRERGS
jgi:hypothetical protein